MSSLEQQPAGDGQGAQRDLTESLPTQVSGAFYQSTDWLSFGVTASIALAVYGYTLAPEVTLGDSGVLAAAAMYGGPAHPPGFPVWTIYAWLFTKLLPWSNIAWRVAVSSAVAGALACGVVALLVCRGGAMILEGVAGFKRLPANDEKWLCAVSGCIAGFGFGFGGTFWGDAVIVETQPLGILLLSLTFCLLLRWVFALEETSYLYAAALVYGLTLTVSLEFSIALPALPFIVLFQKPALGRDIFFATAVTIFLALIVHALGLLPMIIEGVTQLDSLFLIWSLLATFAVLISVIGIVLTRRLLTEWRTVSVGGLTLLLGFSFYLYIAIASMTNPPVNWGYARTLEGFVHAISRGQFERLHPTSHFGDWLRQVGQYGIQTVREVGWPYLLCAILPFCFCHKMGPRERGWLLGLIPIFLCLSLFMVAMLNAPLDRAVMGMIKEFFVASHLILILWSGYGLVLLGTVLSRKKTTR
jgi:hypothetical protein